MTLLVSRTYFKSGENTELTPREQFGCNNRKLNCETRPTTPKGIKDLYDPRLTDKGIFTGVLEGTI